MIEEMDNKDAIRQLIEEIITDYYETAQYENPERGNDFIPAIGELLKDVILIANDMIEPSSNLTNRIMIDNVTLQESQTKLTKEHLKMVREAGVSGKTIDTLQGGD